MDSSLLRYGRVSRETSFATEATKGKIGTDQQPSLALTLWLGIPTALAAFYVGLECGVLYINFLNESQAAKIRAVKASPEELVYTARGYVAIAVMTITGGGCTLQALFYILTRWWRVWKHPKYVVLSDAYDLKDEDGVAFIAFGFAMAAFSVGFYVPLLTEMQIVVLFTIAALPTILQLIDLHGQRRRN